MAYVDKDKLPLIFAKAINEFDDLDVPISEVAIKIGQTIRNLPTADVEEVKHGEWEVCSDEYEICASEFVCSNCKESFCSSELTDEQFFEMLKFCPNCGAKMDGGKAE